MNNVETIAVVPEILRRGVDWWTGQPERNRGTSLFRISGHVERPCNVEEEMGIPLRELLDKHGGVRGGRDKLLAVILGGSSVPCITHDVCSDIRMDFDSLRGEVRLGHGSRDRQDHRPTSFRSSAASRTSTSTELRPVVPCREGTGWMHRVLDRMAKGQAEVEEIDMLLDVSYQIEGHTICALGDAAAWPVQGLIRNFRPVMEARLSGKKVDTAEALAAVAAE